MVSTEEVSVPFFDVRGADPFFIINNAARCSIGGLWVAGRGSRDRRPLWASGATTTTGFNQEAQGTFTGVVLPRATTGRGRGHGDWTPRPVVNDFNGGEVTVGGSEEAPVPVSICRSAAPPPAPAAAWW